MSNLETTESKNTVKYDLAGTTEELIGFLIALGNKIGSIELESRENGAKRKHIIKWIGFLCTNLRIIGHEDASLTGNGIRRINDLLPENVLMDRDYLETEMDYTKAKLPGGVWLSIMGEIIDSDQPEFQIKFNQMIDFPPVLVESLMKMVKKIIKLISIRLRLEIKLLNQKKLISWRL